MQLIKFAGVALAASAAALTLRSYRPELAMQVSLAACVVILLAALDIFGGVVDSIRALAARFDISGEYLGIMLKVVGISFIIQFAVDACRDSGENAIAGKVELAGKLMIAALCVPVMAEMLGMIADTLGNIK